MMTRLRTPATIFSLLAAFFSVSPRARAEVSFWLSPVGTVGGGFIPGNLSTAFPGGENQSLYVWLRNTAQLRSIALDLSSTTPDAIDITGVEVFSPALLVTDIKIGDRWNVPVSEGTVSPDGQSVTNFSAVNVDKSGLLPATRDFDELYDPAADAALFARIDFTTGPYGGDFFSTTNIVLSEGATKIVEASNPNPPELHFATAIVEIGRSEFVGISVAGNGKGIVNNDETPSLLDGTDFGAVPAGSLQQRTFTINAYQDGPLALQPPTITGPYSILGEFPTIIEDSASFTVQLHSSVPFGSHPGSISFANNSDNAPLFSFALGASIVPEPATFTILLVCAGCLFSGIRRR